MGEKVNKPVEICLSASSYYVPDNIVLSKELDYSLNCSIGEHERYSGVKQRAYAHKESSVEMGYKVASKVLDKANLTIDDVDLIIAACATKHQQIPNNSSIILSFFNTSKLISAFDIDASCLSYLVALNTASLYNSFGQYNTILIVSAERAHIALNKSDIKTNALFGDGAAATIITRPQPGNISSKILGYEFVTLSKYYKLCQIKGGGSGKNIVTDPLGIENHHLFVMNGKKLFKLALENLPFLVDLVCKKSGISKTDIDLVIPHQASKQANELIRKKLGFSQDMFLSIIENYGNQVSAAIPTCFSLALEQNRINRGTKVLFLGSAAGISFGAMILEY